mmetsp:Transcript_17873/g.55477  ORF Transcript_17873/g.55477 Transcript_17873/m.55477 type:complete len:355 (+) Transcript_17873:1573-2637(+)
MTGDCEEKPSATNLFRLFWMEIRSHWSPSTASSTVKFPVRTSSSVTLIVFARRSSPPVGTIGASSGRAVVGAKPESVSCDPTRNRTISGMTISKKRFGRRSRRIVRGVTIVTDDGGTSVFLRLSKPATALDGSLSALYAEIALVAERKLDAFGRHVSPTRVRNHDTESERRTSFSFRLIVAPLRMMRPGTACTWNVHDGIRSASPDCPGGWNSGGTPLATAVPGNVIVTVSLRGRSNASLDCNRSRRTSWPVGCTVNLKNAISGISFPTAVEKVSVVASFRSPVQICVYGERSRRHWSPSSENSNQTRPHRTSSSVTLRPSLPYHAVTLTVPAETYTRKASTCGVGAAPDAIHV